MTKVAAIDCGTNSIRLLVASVAGGQLVELDRRMRIVRLGEGVDRTGSLAPQALERTRAALSEYVSVIDSFGVDRIRMVATSATRDASNANDFRDMVTATLGVAPEVVSGDEEAELSFEGAVRGLPTSYAAPYLVVDIGGGSTEFVVGDRAVTAARSVDIGCVRMTERHLVSDPPTPAQIAAATRDIEAGIDEALAVVPGRSAATLIGLAGSVTTVAAIALELPAYDPQRIHHARISYQRVGAVSDELLAMDKASRLAIPVMHPGRADVIGAGALILKLLMRKVGTESVVASEHDILDGIAWSVAR
jgi:exopolyphosphatase/guanosine-5'-triphosphate,3'-diphosphate pyrophosphatase